MRKTNIGWSSHQIGHLSIADLDDALNVVYPARHVHAKERARNRLRAVGRWFGDGRVWLGGRRRSVQEEVPPLGPGYKVLDAPDAKAALDKTPVLLPRAGCAVSVTTHAARE